MTGQPGQPGGAAGAGERLVVGLVRGIHGLRGMVRVEVLTDNESRFDAGSTLFREGSDQPLTVLTAHRDGPGLLVRFREAPTREAAESLRGAYLEAERQDLADGEFYWHDIVGCAVVTSDGVELGTVSDVFRVGEAEVYSVVGPRGETLVPAVAAVVKELNPAAKRIVVDGDVLGISNPADNEIKP